MTRTQSYSGMEQALEAYPPEGRVTTNMVLTRAPGPVGPSTAAVRRELAKLVLAAEGFGVVISTAFNEDGGTALVVLNGEARRLGAVAAFMANTEPVSAR